MLFLTQRHLLDVKAQHAFLWKTTPSIGRKSVKACFYIYIYIIYIYNRYIKTRTYSTATLCQNFKAIGEQLSEIYAFEHDLRFCTNRHLHFYLYRWHDFLLHYIYEKVKGDKIKRPLVYTITTHFHYLTHQPVNHRSTTLCLQKSW
jgi:hypothetical protein